MKSYSHEEFMEMSMPLKYGDILRDGDYRLSKRGNKLRWYPISSTLYGTKYLDKKLAGTKTEIRRKASQSIRFILED